MSVDLEGAERVHARPSYLFDKHTHYCPGCGHGILLRILAEAIDEMGIGDRAVVINPVGCAVFIYHYLNCDQIQAAHGRAPAVATGVKRLKPELVVISYQGDGDLAAIGTAEIVHAANRSENISVVFVNNAVYGMTGGQMAPTTLPGQVTTTTPFGRDVRDAGGPIKVSEMLSQLDGPVYIERVSVSSPKNIIKTEKAIKKSLRVQMENKGFSLVEVLSNCPTNWKMRPQESMKWVEREMTKHFPLGVYKDRSGLP